MRDSQVQAVVKLGGSAISEKRRKKATPKNDVLRRLAQEIASAHFTGVVVHGGGSYGHPLAKEFHLAEGFGSPEQIRGVIETHRSMLDLNRIVMSALSEAGCLAFPFSPSSCFVTHNGRIRSAFMEPIISAIKLGCMPVLYGDVVFDSKLGFTILSGDQIASHLAQELSARRLIFALELDGVYTKDPNLQGARLIEKLNPNRLLELARRTSIKTSGIDVTGGMRKKLLESVPAVKAGINVCFAGISQPGNIRSAIKGNAFKGTFVQGSRES